MIGDSMVPSIGSIRSVIRAAKALTDKKLAVFRVPIRMAHESTVCQVSFSASRLAFNDQFLKSLQKTKTASLPGFAKTNKTGHDQHTFKSAGNSQPRALLPLLRAEQQAMRFA